MKTRKVLGKVNTKTMLDGIRKVIEMNKELKQSDHTPTPWNMDNEGYIHVPETSADGLAIAQSMNLPSRRVIAKVYDEKGTANASYIVRAVNHFEEMAELLRASQGMTTEQGWKSWSIQVKRLNAKLAEGK